MRCSTIREVAALPVSLPLSFRTVVRRWLSSWLHDMAGCPMRKIRWGCLSSIVGWASFGCFVRLCTIDVLSVYQQSMYHTLAACSSAEWHIHIFKTDTTAGGDKLHNRERCVRCELPHGHAERSVDKTQSLQHVHVGNVTSAVKRRTDRRTKWRSASQ